MRFHPVAAFSILVMAIVLLFVACEEPVSDDQSPDAAPAASVLSPVPALSPTFAPDAAGSPTPAAAASLLPTPEPSLAPSPNVSSTPQAISAPQVTEMPPALAAMLTPSPTPESGRYDQDRTRAEFAPSLALIGTDDGATGTGFVIEGGYVITNAHVVRSHEFVLIWLPNDETHPHTPVVAIDRVADIAVLGPIETSAPPIDLYDGDAEPSRFVDTFAIGFAGGDDDWPDPTITQGEHMGGVWWQAVDVSYQFSNAKVAHGQSGGLMITAYGDVIAMLTYITRTSELAAGIGSADVKSRVARLIAGEDT